MSAGLLICVGDLQHCDLGREIGDIPDDHSQEPQKLLDTPKASVAVERNATVRKPGKRYMTIGKSLQSMSQSVVINGITQKPLQQHLLAYVEPHRSSVTRVTTGHKVVDEYLADRLQPAMQRKLMEHVKNSTTLGGFISLLVRDTYTNAFKQHAENVSQRPLPGTSDVGECSTPKTVNILDTIGSGWPYEAIAAPQSFLRSAIAALTGGSRLGIRAFRSTDFSGYLPWSQTPVWWPPVVRLTKEDSFKKTELLLLLNLWMTFAHDSLRGCNGVVLIANKRKITLAQHLQTTTDTI